MLYVEIKLDEGLHVYGQPIPEGYIPTEVTVTAPEGIVVSEPRYPETEPFRVEGIDEQFHVFGDEARIAIMVQRNEGELESIPLEITVRYQACNDRECFLPQTKQLRLDVPAAALNRPQRRD